MSSLLSKNTALTVDRTQGAILRVVNGDLIWACCALASDKTCSSKQYLEKEASHGVEVLVGLVVK
jgi:hypothetical protein